MLHAMKTFRVFHHPAHGYQAVKIGFSWPGFLFSVIWLLIKKLWRQALLVMAAVLLLASIEMYFQNIQTSVMVLLLEFSIYVFVGVYGNEWRMANLEARGFKVIDTLEAETPDGAIRKIVKE